MDTVNPQAEGGGDMDTQINTAAYRRHALRSMRGRWLPLMLVSGVTLVSGMGVTGLSARTGWLLVAVLIARLIHPMLRYGQTLYFTQCFRGKNGRFGMLLRYGLWPKLLGLFALRDLPPFILIVWGDLARARDATSLSGQALQAAGLLLGGALALHYCMAEYLLVDRPALSPIAALRASRRLLSGRRLPLFMLVLGFTGWGLLAAAAFALFYMIAYTASAGTLVVAAYLLLIPLATWFDMTCIAYFERICAGTPSRRRERL